MTVVLRSNKICIKYYASLRAYYLGKTKVTQQILTVRAQPTESVVILKKIIIKTMQARGNRFGITINDWFISAGRGLCDEKNVQDYINFNHSTIYVLKRRRDR